MRLRARFVGGAFRPVEALDLPEGAEFVLHVEEAAPEAWWEQASPRCLRVGSLTAWLSWHLPGPGSGAPQARECRLRACPGPPTPERDLAACLREGTFLASVRPAGGALSAGAAVALEPGAGDRILWVGLEFEDPEGAAHPVALVPVHVPPIESRFEDRPGLEPPAWQAEGTWGRLPDGTWADSPHGDYANNANFSLTSPGIDLAGLSDTGLRFEERHNIEEGSDRCFLEVAPEGGEWERLDQYTGVADWTVRRYDLSRFAGGSVRLRFRLVTDRSITRDGIYVRAVRVAGFTR